jgi:hypothetical protein
MRLWSLHPRYLDSKGLVALWREALLAQAVLLNKTRGYKHHPQLLRFKGSASPSAQISNYLHAVHSEAVRRGYRFDRRKLRQFTRVDKISVTRDQIEHEWEHLKGKLRSRAPDSLKQLENVTRPQTHPLFRVISGPVAEWEILPSRARV